MKKIVKNGKYGFVNQQGELVIPCVYDNAEDFNDGLASVNLNGKYGFVNQQGELVIPCVYDDEEQCKRIVITNFEFSKIFITPPDQMEK